MRSKTKTGPVQTQGAREKITLRTLQEMKTRGEPVTWLTAYDYPMASLMDRARIDMILVGDSAGMTVLGHATTLPVTMDQMITFTAAVSRAVKYAFVIGDMPYMSYQISDEQAIANAGRFMAEGGADAVKLEGGARVGSRVRAITEAGIPVMGHIGLTPQSLSQLGGYRAQGREAQLALQLIEDALALEASRAFALLLECIPAEVSALIHDRLQIPVYGIGSGPHVDGHLMIVHDMLGLFERFTPRFVKRYANLGAQMLEAFGQYGRDVREHRYPGPEHRYGIPQSELRKVRRALRKPRK